MKRLSLISGALLATTLGAAAQSGAFCIQGYLPQLPDSTKLSLREVAHEPMPDMLVAYSKDGRFLLEGSVEQPLAAALFIDNKFPVTDTRFILEPGTILLSADTAAVNSARIELPGFKVAGSPLSVRYRSLLSVRDALDRQYADNHARHKGVMEEYYAARSERNEQKMKQIEQTDAYHAWQADEKAFFRNVDETFTSTILANKDDFFGPLMMISLLNFFDDSSREVFDQLSPAARESLYGQRVAAELYPVGKIGDLMPPISLADRNGQTVTLEQVTEGKKYVLLDFWASWCRPCRAEIPNLKRIYKEYASRGLDIMSVSIDDDPAAWQTALDQTKMPWHNVIDIEDKAAADYKVRAVPTIYLLDGQGRLVAENLRGEELAAKISELLSQ